MFDDEFCNCAGTIHCNHCKENPFKYKEIDDGVREVTPALLRGRNSVGRSFLLRSF